METCRASIILVVYNGIQYLPDCLGAVMAEQQASPGCEVVVVDNASTDGSVDWMAVHYPTIRLLRNERNLGFAAACNQGAAAASGEALVFLNQDTRVQPGWLKALVEGLYQGENVGLTTSKLLFMSRPEQINLCGQDILYTGMTFGRGTLRHSGEFDAPEEVGTVAGASFAIRRSLWEQLGGFDEAFFMYYEETDLSWRASLLGYTCRYIPGSIALHDAGLKPSPGAAYYSARNRQMLLWKHWKWTTFFLLMPAWFMTELVEWVYLMRLGSHYTTGKLRACAWLLAHPRQILQARRSAQMGRKVSDLQLLGQCTWKLSPRVLSIGQIGSALIRMANLLLELNYRASLRLAQWLKL